MKTAFLVAVVVALVAAAAWALSSSEPTGRPYTVEISDVAGLPGFVVSPEVVTTEPGVLAVPEVVVRANQMPEVVVSASALREVASLAEPGPVVWN